MKDQKSKRKKLALIVPSSRPEPFIQTHMNGLEEHFELLVYTGGFLPDEVQLNGKRSKVGGWWFRGGMKLLGKFLQKDEGFSRRVSLVRSLRRKNVDLVLAEYGFVGAYVAEACRRSKIPLVVHFHGYDAYVKDRINGLKERYRKLFTIARKIVAVSHDMKEQLISLGAPEKKVEVNVYGVDGDRFVQQYPAKSPPKAIFWGRLVPKKAPYLTLIAFAKALEKVPQARLVFIGDGPLKEVIRTLVEALGLEEKVEFIRQVPHAELPAYMESARVYVQHSIVTENGDSEGSPNSILEASASGLPVISTLHGGIKELVQDGRTGFLVEEKDVDRMGDRMAELFMDPDRAGEMGQEGRSWVMEHYASSRSSARLIKILESVIEN